MTKKPDLSFWQLWNLSFGFFGVQIAYALQSANISRIFATLGADPHSLSFFWILPPLMGIIVQPLVGKYSDRTWCRFGRRIPYLFAGALVAVLIMCLLPNSGSLGLTKNIVIWGMTGAMLFGLFSLMMLDTSINMAMQPFKMLVGDMVNEEQKTKAYSIQSFLCNAGSVVGFLFPYILARLYISNTAPEGVVPDTVIYSFYAGAAILILCVLYTSLTVKEWNPEDYARYNESEDNSASSSKDEPSMLTLLAKAPSAFWSVGLVQFFCWAAFLCMWSYTNGSIATLVFDTPVVDGLLSTSSEAYQEAGNWVGVLYAVQAVGSMAWAAVIPFLPGRKFAYVLSLILGGIGFIATNFVHDPYLMFIPFVLIGCAWAAMLALPFTLLTNALQGRGHMGTYLGLFNGTICLPQIVMAATGGIVLGLMPIGGNGAPNEPLMLVFAGCLLLCGAVAVNAIKEK